MTAADHELRPLTGDRMADEHTYRAYRSNEHAREPAKTAQGNDPLAELARLIGQNDPFAEFGRKPQATQQQAVHPSQEDWAPQPYPSQDYGQGTDFQPGQERAGYEEHGSHYDSDPYYQDGAYQSDQPYDDVPPPSPRRLTILVIAAVAALAVIGTASAVGYRALFGSTGSSPPPVIKADATPAKVVPPSKSEQQSNKLIYDRVGERGGEKIVSREEQPLDINKAAQATFPNTNAPQSAFPSAFPTGQQPVSTDASVASVDQPKKVRTIAIRPDQPIGAQTPPQGQPSPQGAGAPMPSQGRPSPQAASPPPPPRPAAPQRLASAPQVATADPDAATSATTRSAAHPARPAHNAPLSLSPNAAPPPAEAPVRTASAPATRNPAPAAEASGQYAVQISSQRSEAEAQAAFRALQAKYPTQLGGRQPIIRRADLGSKGIYYRAMVGPFADSGDASALCQSLKAAGGNCLIQKN